VKISGIRLEDKQKCVYLLDSQSPLYILWIYEDNDQHKSGQGSERKRAGVGKGFGVALKRHNKRFS